MRALKPLSHQDLQLDPYYSHPTLGETGYAIARLYYNELDLTTAYVLEPKDVISHIATCPYNDDRGLFSAPCVVILSLDLVCEFLSAKYVRCRL